MANYSIGPIFITIKIEDTYVVEISNDELIWKFVTQIKTKNCSQVTELNLQRKYEDLSGSFKWADWFSSNLNESAATEGMVIFVKVLFEFREFYGVLRSLTVLKTFKAQV